jgi:hypothetical protein
MREGTQVWIMLLCRDRAHENGQAHRGHAVPRLLQEVVMMILTIEQVINYCMKCPFYQHTFWAPNRRKARIMCLKYDDVFVEKVCPIEKDNNKPRRLIPEEPTIKSTYKE